LPAPTGGGFVSSRVSPDCLFDAVIPAVAPVLRQLGIYYVLLVLQLVDLSVDRCLYVSVWRDGRGLFSGKRLSLRCPAVG
jgi:hypothetical protein